MMAPLLPSSVIGSSFHEIYDKWNGHLLQTMMRQDSCSEARKAVLGDWEETLYFHCSNIIDRLRAPNSPEHALGIGVTFREEFMRTSRQAMEDLHITDAIGPTSLLKLTGRADGTCAVCLENLERADCLLRMPCSHAFHWSCLVMLLPTRYTCPMCTYELNWKIIDDLPPPPEDWKIIDICRRLRIL